MATFTLHHLNGLLRNARLLCLLKVSKEDLLSKVSNKSNYRSLKEHYLSSKFTCGTVIKSKTIYLFSEACNGRNARCICIAELIICCQNITLNTFPSIIPLTTVRVSAEIRQ